jgi:hypothetical protein
MATNVIPAPFGRAKPTHAELTAIRAALVLRIDAAAEKAKWDRDPESTGMPHRLFAAGCYLAAHGFQDAPCDGERWFHSNFIAYAALANAEMIEDGRRAIYEGGRRAVLQLVPMQVAA